MTDTKNNGLLYVFYRSRVGEPTTHDEVRGHWVFLTGVLLDTIGILLFIPSAPLRATSFTLREASIFVAAVGLVMMMAGPVIRLPLQSWANYAAYAGQAIGFVAAAWFVLVFPNDWAVVTGNQPVIVLYAPGLAVITIGGALAPLLVASDDAAAARATAAEAAETARTEFEWRLDSLHARRGRFEIYEDAAGEHRWRLRHRNGNILMDSGEGYASRSGARDGIESVKRTAPAAGIEG